MLLTLSDNQVSDFVARGMSVQDADIAVRMGLNANDPGIYTTVAAARPAFQRDSSNILQGPDTGVSANDVLNFSAGLARAGAGVAASILPGVLAPKQRSAQVTPLVVARAPVSAPMPAWAKGLLAVAAVGGALYVGKKILK